MERISKRLYEKGIPKEVNPNLYSFFLHSSCSGDDIYTLLKEHPKLAMQLGDSGALILDEPRVKSFRAGFVLEEDVKFTPEDLQFDNCKLVFSIKYYTLFFCVITNFLCYKVVVLSPPDIGSRHRRHSWHWRTH